MNTVFVRYPTMTTQSLHQQSLYQQTYVDRHSNVTDVYVQEQYSQREFYSQQVAPTVYVNNPCPYVPPYIAPAPAPRPPMAYDPYASQFAYGPTAYGPTVRGPPPTTVGYYCVNSAATSSSGQYFYPPEPQPCAYPTASRAAPSTQECYGAYSSDSSATPPPIYFVATQTQTTPIKCAEAATQANMDMEELAGVKEMFQKLSTDPQNSEASKFLSMERWSWDFIRKLVEVQGERRNSEMRLPEQHMQDIIRLAINGSDISERVANSHCNRPCFKKIDTLCARLKQDLCRLDGVLANINSQGVAWAVKDFIFLFTRIMSAWTILKSYLYNHADGIKKIVDLLPAGFVQVFNTWQLATIPLIDLVVQSILNLDAGARPQKTYPGGGGGDNSPPAGNRGSHSHSSPDAGSRHSPTNANREGQSSTGNYGRTMMSGATGNNQDSPPHHGSGNSTPRMEEHKPTIDQPGAAGGDHLQAEAAAKPKGCQNLIDMYTMIENSEERQRHVDASGTYLKTGTYQPLQKEIIPSRAAFVMRVPPGFKALPHLHGKPNETVAPEPKPKPKPLPEAAENVCKPKPKPMPEYDPYFHGYDKPLAVPQLAPIKPLAVPQLAPYVNENADDPSKYMPDLRTHAQPEKAEEPAKTKPKLRDIPKLEIDPYVPCYGFNTKKPQKTPELETFTIGDALEAYEKIWKGNAMQEFYPTPPDNMVDLMTPPNDDDDDVTPPMFDSGRIKINLEIVKDKTTEEVKAKGFGQNTKAHNQLLEDLEPYASMLGAAYSYMPPADIMENIKLFMNPYSPINTEVARDLIELKERVLELQNVAHFFQNNLRRIMYISTKKLSNYIDSYELSLGEMLSKPPHQPHEHDHINGIPGEKVFNYDIL